MKLSTRKKNREEDGPSLPRSVRTQIHTGVHNIIYQGGGYSGSGGESIPVDVMNTTEQARRVLDMLKRKQRGEPINAKLLETELPDGNILNVFIVYVDEKVVCDE